MTLFLLSFSLSLISTLILVRYKHLHNKISSDYDVFGPQKFHAVAVPRIGGVGIYITLVISTLIAENILVIDMGFLPGLCLTAFPAFIAGLMEDLTKKVSIKTRLLSTITSSLLGIYFLNILITKIDVPGIDWLLAISLISIIFTTVAISGLSNAYNIIDGFNGLSSMVAIITITAIAYIAFRLDDIVLASTCLITVGAIGGFFVWNYPRGLIFLGDGGAYLIGYFTATLSILLVSRNPTVSPWFSLLINSYPIFETLFTIWRRKIHQGKSPGLPDGIHFHTLIHRRVIRWTDNKKSLDAYYVKNAKTAPYLWLFSSLATVPAIIWWQDSLILQFFLALFCISYLWAYDRIVRFKIPKIFKVF